MALTTLAHTLTNDWVSQFGHCNPEIADMFQNRYTNSVYHNYVININYLAIYTTSDARAVTMSLSEYNVYMVISWGH